MRNSIIAIILACAAPTAVPLAAAPPAPESTGPLMTQVSILRLDDDAADKPEELKWSGYSSFSWSKWITGEDIPADLRNRSLTIESYAQIEVDEAGKAVGCRIVKASSEARLDRLACELLSRRARFDPLYAAPTRAIPSKWVMGVRWEVMEPGVFAERERASAESRRNAIALPPLLDSYPQYRDWPRLAWSHNVRIAALPPIQASYPPGAGRPADGVVSLDLFVRPEVGIADCAIGISSGNRALDEAACRVARSLELSYHEPCSTCPQARVPLQIVWRRQGSHIRLPLGRAAYPKTMDLPRDPADRRTAREYVAKRTLLSPALAPSDFARIADRHYSRNYLQVELSVDVNGRATACTAKWPSGNAAIDQRACDLLLKRARFTARTDIFGDPTADTLTLAIDLRELLP